MPFNNSISKYDWQYIVTAFFLISVFIFKLKNIFLNRRKDPDKGLFYYFIYIAFSKSCNENLLGGLCILFPNNLVYDL